MKIRMLQDYRAFKEGYIYNVKRVDCITYDNLLCFEFAGIHIHRFRAEIIMEDKFEPRSGMIFETMDGLFGLIIDVGDKLLYFHRHWGACPITEPFVKSRYATANEGWGIKAIYQGFTSDVGTGYRTQPFSDINHSPSIISNIGRKLWSRPKQQCTELTLQQIANKFNVAVEELRIKDR